MRDVIPIGRHSLNRLKSIEIILNNIFAHFSFTSGPINRYNNENKSTFRFLDIKKRLRREYKREFNIKGFKHFPERK